MRDAVELQPQHENLENPITFINEINNFKQGIAKKDEEHLNHLIDVNKAYLKPPTCLEMSGITLFTRGSISSIIGKAKSGKTALSVRLVAAALDGGRGAIDDGLISAPEKGTVIFFDTEQGAYYGSLTVSNIKKIHSDCSALKYYDLREHHPKKRLELMQKALEYWSAKDKVSLVVVDGIKDVVFDINNPEEATTTITELMRLSVKYDCHITSILHQNKGDNNARGHIGTELTNKSEIVIAVSKHEVRDDFAIISAEYSRGLPFNDFGITRDEAGTPIFEKQVPNVSRSKVPMLTPSKFELIIHKEVASYVFSENEGLRYSDLKSDIKLAFEELKGEQFGDSKAKDFIRHWQNENIILQKGETPHTKYYLNDENDN